MPVIPLKNDNFDPWDIWAIMLYPNDAKLRKEHKTVVFHRNIREAASKGDPSSHVILADPWILLDMPSLQEVLDREFTAGRKGSVVGDVLLFLLEMIHTGVGKPSFRKAIFVAEDYWQAVPFGDGRERGCSEKTIRQYWKDYQSVAHLWAAFRLCQFSDDEKLWNEKTQVFGPQFLSFLGIASWIWSASLKYLPSHSKISKPLLDINALWRIPKKYSLPKGSTCTIEDIPTWMKDRIKEYKRNYNPYG